MGVDDFLGLSVRLHWIFQYPSTVDFARPWDCQGFTKDDRLSSNLRTIRPDVDRWSHVIELWSDANRTGIKGNAIGNMEGIRILEIPAPYYGDRLRRQFPPSSRILTLALRSPLPLCILAILVLHILSPTQCWDILMSRERTSVDSGR